MIKVFRRFPIVGAVAAQTITAEGALVLVLVAGGACRRKAEEGPVLVLDRNKRRVVRTDSLSVVALRTFQRGVFARQRPARFGVVEARRRRCPAYEIEVLAIVFRVAFCAFGAALLVGDDGRVIAMVGGQSPGDLAMAVEAAELRGTDARRVALRAIGGSFQLLMGARQGAWRNLRGRGI